MFFFLIFFRRNMLCIFKLIYGVGLRALRKLFMEINPAWSNQPSDALAFDRGSMKLAKDEEIVFNRGDINKWDFSLMTTALLYSKTCALEISKRQGYTLALRELKTCRNNLVGHPSTEKMSDEDFQTFWPHLSNNFEILGADPDDIAEIIRQSGTSYSKYSIGTSRRAGWAVSMVCCNRLIATLVKLPRTGGQNFPYTSTFVALVCHDHYFLSNEFRKQNLKN